MSYLFLFSRRTRIKRRKRRKKKKRRKRGLFWPVKALLLISSKNKGISRQGKDVLFHDPGTKRVRKGLKQFRQ